MGFLDKAKDMAGKASQGLSGLKDMGEDKLKEVINNFNEARPFLEDAGYKLSGLQIEMGVPPKLTTEFECDNASEEKINSALESLKDNKVGLMVLKSLIKANGLQNGISLKGLKFSHIEIEVGLIPNVRLIFS
jgi:hypothetical protein